MSRKVQVKQQSTAKPTSKKPLTTVSFENGFHFYTAIGNYTGITATSLSEFAAKLTLVPMESIAFHFQRKDFENWIKYTIRDAALAERIGRIKAEQTTGDLGKDLLSAVKTFVV